MWLIGIGGSIGRLVKVPKGVERGVRLRKYFGYQGFAYTESIVEVS